MRARKTELLDRYWSDSKKKKTDREVRGVELELERADCLELARDLTATWDVLVRRHEPSQEAVDRVVSNVMKHVDAATALGRDGRNGRSFRTRRVPAHFPRTIPRVPVLVGGGALVAVVALVVWMSLPGGESPDPFSADFLREARNELAVVRGEGDSGDDTAIAFDLRAPQSVGALVPATTDATRAVAATGARYFDEPTSEATVQVIETDAVRTRAALLRADLILNHEAAVPRLRGVLASAPSVLDRAQAHQLLNLARDPVSAPDRVRFLIELFEEFPAESRLQRACLGSFTWYVAKVTRESDVLRLDGLIPGRDLRQLAGVLLQAFEEETAGAMASLSPRENLLARSVMSWGSERQINRVLRMLLDFSRSGLSKAVVAIIDDQPGGAPGTELALLRLLLDDEALTAGERMNALMRMNALIRQGPAYTEPLAGIVPVLEARLRDGSWSNMEVAQIYMALGGLGASDAALELLRDGIARREPRAVDAFRWLRLTPSAGSRQRLQNEIVPLLIEIAEAEDASLSSLALISLAALYPTAGSLPSDLAERVRDIAADETRSVRTRERAIECIGSGNPAMVRELLRADLDLRIQLAALRGLLQAGAERDAIGLLAEVLDRVEADGGDEQRNVAMLLHEFATTGDAGREAPGPSTIAAVERVLAETADSNLAVGALRLLRRWGAMPGPSLLRRLASAPLVSAIDVDDSIAARKELQRRFGYQTWCRVLAYARDADATNAALLDEALDRTNSDFRLALRRQADDLPAFAAVRAVIAAEETLSPVLLDALERMFETGEEEWLLHGERAVEQAQLREAIAAWVAVRDRSFTNWTAWLESDDEAVVRRALLKSPLLVGSQARTALLELLEHPDPDVSQLACETLRRKLALAEGVDAMPAGCNRSGWQDIVERCEDGACSSIDRVAAALAMPD